MYNAKATGQLVKDDTFRLIVKYKSVNGQVPPSFVPHFQTQSKQKIQNVLPLPPNMMLGCVKGWLGEECVKNYVDDILLEKKYKS